MIISDEQARLAAECLRHGGACATSTPHGEVSSELMERFQRAIAAAPDTRVDRVEEARARMSAGPVDAYDVASKLIGRVMSDSLR